MSQLLRFHYGCVQHADDSTTTFMAVSHEINEGHVVPIRFLVAGSYAEELERQIAPSIHEYATIGEHRNAYDLQNHIGLEVEYYLDDILEREDNHGLYTWVMEFKTHGAADFHEAAFGRDSSFSVSAMLQSHQNFHQTVKEKVEHTGNSYINLHAIRMPDKKLQQAAEGMVEYFSGMTTAARPRTSAIFGEW